MVNGEFLALNLKFVGKAEAIPVFSFIIHHSPFTIIPRLTEKAALR